jgi:hypothetical protein
MTEPPRRFKELEELSPDEHAERRRTGRTEFETEEYIEGRQKVLAESGYADADAPKTIDEMTPADHAARRFGRQ